MQPSPKAARAASLFEVVVARAWNLLNEGKPFHYIFVAGSFILYHFGNLLEGNWGPVAAAVLTGTPIAAIYMAFDFPLHLRWLLWVPLLAWVGLTGGPDLALLGLALGLHLFFTIFFWGSLYYNLRIGTPLTNFRRFWRMVLENSDSTSVIQRPSRADCRSVKT